MEFHVEEGKQLSEVCSILILAALSIKNVGQLAVDLLISSLRAERIGLFDQPNVLPCVGNNAYSPSLPGNLVLPLEAYDSSPNRLTLIHQRSPVLKAIIVRTSKGNSHRCVLGANCTKGFRFSNAVKNCGLVSSQHTSDFELRSSGVEERFAATKEKLIHGTSEGVIALGGVSSNEAQTPSVQTELIVLLTLAIAGQAIQPLAQLMETTYIGKLGALELASAGISILIFNIIQRCSTFLSLVWLLHLLLKIFLGMQTRILIQMKD